MDTFIRPSVLLSWIGVSQLHIAIVFILVFPYCSFSPSITVTLQMKLLQNFKIC
jgi:hypothetical protein